MEWSGKASLEELKIKDTGKRSRGWECQPVTAKGTAGPEAQRVKQLGVF